MKSKRLTRNIAIISMMMIMLVLLAASASALGVTPARTELDYNPGTVQVIPVSIINNENKNMKLMISAEGSLADYLEIENDVITMDSSESLKQIGLKLNIPENARPGMNEIRLKILEYPADSGENVPAAMIGATVEIIHQIRLNVPYPGVYAEIPEVYITTPYDEEYAQFTLPIFNRGRKDLAGIKGTITIYDPDGNAVGIIETNSIDLKSQAEGKIEAKFFSPESRGKFKAEIIVKYADKEIRFEKEFFMKKELIEVEGVTVDDFRLGSIAKLNVILNSKWNEKIEGVYADIEIKDDQNNQLTKYKTSSIDIDAESSGILNAYWNTEEISPGTYYLHLMLYYTGFVTGKWYTMDVGFNSISIRGSPITGADITVTDMMGKNTLYIIIGLAILIFNIINFVLFMKFFRRKKKEGIT